jgi:hypothetical protein
MHHRDRPRRLEGHRARRRDADHQNHHRLRRHRNLHQVHHPDEGLRSHHQRRRDADRRSHHRDGHQARPDERRDHRDGHQAHPDGLLEARHDRRLREEVGWACRTWIEGAAGWACHYPTEAASAGVDPEHLGGEDLWGFPSADEVGHLVAAAAATAVAELAQGLRDEAPVAESGSPVWARWTNARCSTTG